MLTVAWCVLTVAGHVWTCHMNEGRDVSTRPVVQYEFDSTLGYPGEGPEHNEGGAWVTVNVAGVHVSVSREASDVDVGEVGSALIHHYHSSVCAILTGGSRYRGIPRFRSPVSNIVVRARYLGRAPISYPRADIV